MGIQAGQRAFPREAGTEADQQRRAAELEQILDSIPQLIAAISASGEVLYLNRSARSYSGLHLEDVRAEDFRVRLFHPEDVERLEEARRRGFLRGEPFELEMRTRRHDGVYRWFLVQYEPLNDADGRILRWCATGTDIDDRKRAEDRVRGENQALRDEIDRAAMFEDIVGSSDSLCAVLRELGKVAATDSTVLVMGETGTGKELIARAIHKRSPRRGRAFVSVNCGAIPTTLLASELFGHERGAFSGAIQQRLGRFELADGGRSSSTRWESCRSTRKLLCCACSKKESSSASAVAIRFASTCGSSRPPIAICRWRPPVIRSARTSSTD